MEQSLGQLHDDKEEQDVDGETAGEDVALDDSLNIMISADANDEIKCVDDNKEGETPTTKEVQHRIDGDDNGLNENETHHKEDVVDDGIDDTTSLGATTITSRVSRAIEYKKDLSALDKFLLAKDDISFVSRRSSRSVSSRNIRRRDVIKPIDLDEKSEITTSSPIATQEGVFIATMDGTVDMQPMPSANNDGNGAENSLEQSNPQCDQQFAMIVRDPKQRTPRQTNLEPEESRAALHLGNDPPGESPTDRPYINHNDGVIHDPSSPIGGGRFRNVQWVDPKDVHDEDIDFGLLNAYDRMSGRNMVNNQSSPSNSVEHQHVMDPPEDLPKNNYYPEEDDSSGKARLTKASVLGDNRRMRIATISSGYKTANYFVREDLDTRIYFQDLEDAINYMSRRGYIRMKKEDEEEWIKLIGKAHGVVKVGPTKKKQRYRKGKLVMILSKEINDNDDDEHKKPQECDSSEVTDRTSLGRSVRCGFKSYSEKFLAEQEADKQSTLLQLTNEAAVERAGHLLPLTNGEVLSAVDESTLESSKASMGSDRKGVYGGGVRYFTTDNDEAEYQSSDEEDGSEEEEDDDEEEESVEEFDGGNEVNESDGDDEEEEDHDEIHEVDGSMGSMFSEEESFMDNRSAGVDSLSASSTLSSGYPSPLQRKETYREPPNGLVPIDDDSMAS